MIHIHLLEDGQLQTHEVGKELDLSPALRPEPAWVEVVAPSAGERAALIEQLGIHELAVEDAMRTGHPPKLEEFDDSLFLIAHTPDSDEESEALTRKIALFWSKEWIVTILRQPLPRLDELLERARRDPKRFLAPPAEFAHAILDHMADGFESLAEDTSERVEDLEEEALARPEPGVMDRILDLRREVAALRRVVHSQRDVCLLLTRESHSALPKKLAPYFRDVYDHLARVTDLLEGIKEGVAAARDAYLAAVNNRLSEIMRVLTVIATIMMPLSLVAGIFGMNFNQMPGTASSVGFWVTLGAMIVIAFGMLHFFKRRNWL